MAELKNVFSWSFSAAEDFEECRRRRYWSKYAMWGGWNKDAPEQARTAYRLGKMENVFSMRGNAVEKAVMWLLREKQAGRDAAPDQAYDSQARPYLNDCWRDSLEKKWLADPKKFCCLREHYYGRPELFRGPAARELVEQIVQNVRLCISNFIKLVLPRLAGVRPEQELKIAAPPAAGDPESFVLNGVKIYAIPDYAYFSDGCLNIHDWKSGKKYQKHLEQIALYALWAQKKYGMPPEKVRGYIEYLAFGETVPVSPTEQSQALLCEKIAQSIADMAGYLVDSNIPRNEPLPAEDWELADAPDVCGQCNFLELCRPELEGK